MKGKTFWTLALAGFFLGCAPKHTVKCPHPLVSPSVCGKEYEYKTIEEIKEDNREEKEKQDSIIQVNNVNFLRDSLKVSPDEIDDYLKIRSYRGWKHEITRLNNSLRKNKIPIKEFLKINRRYNGIMDYDANSNIIEHNVAQDMFGDIYNLLAGYNGKCPLMKGFEIITQYNLSMFNTSKLELFNELNASCDEVELYLRSGLEEDVIRKIHNTREARDKGLNHKSHIIRSIDIGDHISNIKINFQNYLGYRGQEHQADYLVESKRKATTIDDTDLDKILKSNLNFPIPSGNNEKDAQEILDFVHKFVFVHDIDNYTKTPIETIVEGGGDCEDLSVLAYTLMHKAGLDVVYVDYSNHIAIGVAGNFKGKHVTYKGKKYYTAETTGTEWIDKPANHQIGEFENRYNGKKMTIYKHDDKK